MRFDTSWMFDLGADVYAWFTAQSTWRASCARLVEHLPGGSSLRVVDLGCGPGVSTIEMARLRQADHFFGMDIAGRMLSEARRRASSSGLPSSRFNWIRGDSARLPFQTDSVDAITGHSFLYLVYDRQATLAEALRVLRPGGRMVLMEPSAQPATLRSILAVSRDIRHLVSVFLWRPFSRLHGRFTPATLARTLQEAGFIDARVDANLGGLGLLAYARKAL